MIISGQCVATRQDGPSTVELRRLSVGELFGEAAVFTGQPRSATVKAALDTVVGIVDQAALREEMERTSFMSLAIRTVSSTFLDLDRQLLKQRKQSQVVEEALRHFLSAKGSTSWAALRTALARSSGANEDDVSAWVLGAKGFVLEGDALTLRGS